MLLNILCHFWNNAKSVFPVSLTFFSQSYRLFLVFICVNMYPRLVLLSCLRESKHELATQTPRLAGATEVRPLGPDAQPGTCALPPGIGDRVTEPFLIITLDNL